MIAIFILLSVLVIFTLASDRPDYLDDVVDHPEEMIDRINKMNTTWQAKMNFEGWSEEALPWYWSNGVDPDSYQKVLPPAVIDVPKDLPEHFDARENWPDCPTIKEIRNQGCCYSCWDFAAVEAISDRICIHSDSKIKVEISAQDLLACCIGCQKVPTCKTGGSPVDAWEYWVSHGIVTGGSKGSHVGCRPYENYCGNNAHSPQCVHACEKGYNVSYEDDKYYGKNAYSIPNKAELIQAEIYQNGPVATFFKVYDDFFSYKKGVYQHHTSKNIVGYHAVKILGWGTEHGVPYWLVANSWGSGWADEKGFFKILRGQNECGIESHIIAGIPKYSSPK